VLALSEATAAPGAREVVVNLTKVEFFGAIGLTALLTATHRSETTGVPVIVVTHPSQPPHQTITICQLQNELTVIDIPDHGLFEVDHVTLFVRERQALLDLLTSLDTVSLRLVSAGSGRLP
jgi:anti-anti-sigma factor